MSSDEANAPPASDQTCTSISMREGLLFSNTHVGVKLESQVMSEENWAGKETVLFCLLSAPLKAAATIPPVRHWWCGGVKPGRSGEF